MSLDANVADDVVYKIGGFRVERSVVRYIRDASEISGVSFEYMIAKAGHESRFISDASAERSSAEGLYQFTAETWLQQMKRHGAKYGYANLAGKIYRDSRGRYRVTDAKTKKTILALRRSPRISAFLAAEYAKSNKKILQDQVRGEISSADLYIAHFMGPSGAVLLLRADKFTPNKLAADLFPDAAEANPPIFFKKGGKMRTVREVRRELTNIFQDKINRFAKLPKSLKSWLEKNPVQKDFAARKSNVVVSAPQLRVQDEYAEAAAPVPKLADSLDLDSILSGEGVNLDDDKVMAKYMNVAHLSAQSGTSDAVSADFSPVAQATYDVAGVAQIEQESALHTVAAPYSNAAANILEQADVFVKTLPAYSASVEQPDVRQL